jgi:isoleucyl-tRNA synthetase
MEMSMSDDDKKKSLKGTLNLPKTEFAMKANLPQNEPARLAAWEAAGLYEQIRTAREGSPKYILHDGPPYANGAIHLGHALNKCIKDFVVKTKTMAGFDAPYVPGWDCHGLPIEIKVDEKLGGKKLEMDPIFSGRSLSGWGCLGVGTSRTRPWTFRMRRESWRHFMDFTKRVSSTRD